MSTSLKQFLALSVYVVAVSVVAAWWYFDYGHDFIEPTAEEEVELGAILSIAATDKISDSRAIINANFNELASSTIEVGTTTIPTITSLPNLVTVGTLTTGTWNADTITVPYGGTGSTTLSSNQVLLGNGTGAIKVAAGYGTSGQFLTSNGVGAAPTWTSATVDVAANYTWTGNHSFVNATTTYLGVGNHIFSTGTATSTFAGGINLTGGCVSLNGTCVAGGSGSWTIIAQVTSTSTQATTTLAGIPPVDMLRVDVYSPGLSGSTHYDLKFNNNSTDHACHSSEDAAATSTCPPDKINITKSNSARGLYMTMDIRNPSDNHKGFTFQTEQMDETGVAHTLHGGGVFKLDAQINRIDLILDNAGMTQDVGTEIIVWGANL